MDTKIIEKHYNFIIDILYRNSSIFDSKEFTYRVNKLKKTYSKMILNNKIEDEFYSQSHEIRTIDLFNRIGEVDIAKDSQHKAGSDIVFAQKYNIECISCTTGDNRNSERLEKCGYQVYNKINDYNEIFRQMTLRVTSAIEEKKKKLDKYISNRVILSNEPYIIFIYLGPLSEAWFSSKLCPEVTKILAGRGFRQITINPLTCKQVGSDSFNFIPNIKNNNSSDINTNLFGDNCYSGISSIIFTSANLNEIYNFNNTANFLNPHANNKIKISDFGGLPYWNINKESEYVPRIKGKRQVIEIW